MSKEILLGLCQGYMALQYHMEDALIENNLDPTTATCCPPISIFSNKYISEINSLNHDKIYDFCFIGSIKSNYLERLWVIHFAKKYFTSNSIFINTDHSPNWTSLGNFDYSHKQFGYCPKEQANNQSKKVQYRVVEENIHYFETMCKSKFVLCPAGDAPWSFRFYEVLMCKSVPLVKSWHHTYRTKEESEIKYKYVLNTDEDAFDNPILYDEYVKENTKIFDTYHRLH